MAAENRTTNADLGHNLTRRLQWQHLKRKRSKQQAASKTAPERLYRQLMGEKEGVIPLGFAAQVEQDLTGAGKYAVSRRLALVYLEMPFRELTKKVRANRDFAVATAHVSHALGGHIEAYKSLLSWVTAAHARTSMSICVRKDWKEILAEAEKQ
jgi:hypothetical protein